MLLVLCTHSFSCCVHTDTALRITPAFLYYRVAVYRLRALYLTKMRQYNTSIFVLQGCCTSSVPVACLVPYEAAPISAFVSTVVKQSANPAHFALVNGRQVYV